VFINCSISKKTSESHDVEKQVNYALSIGYRLVDTACIYLNDQALSRSFKSNLECKSGAKSDALSNLKRNELFVCSKLWCTHHSKKRAVNQIAATLKSLSLNYLDAFYINWPMGFQVRSYTNNQS
jgi:glycerol 2-dehydrogenase (NADP+)